MYRNSKDDSKDDSEDDSEDRVIFRDPGKSQIRARVFGTIRTASAAPIMTDSPWGCNPLSDPGRQAPQRSFPVLLRPLRWLPLCVLALSLPFGLHAQQTESGGPPSQGGPPRGGPPSPAQELARMDHALTLTDAQKTAILPILTKRQTDLQALRASSTDREAGREQMHTLMEASRTQIRALLTEAQQKTFDSMRPGRGPRPGGDGQKGDGPPPDGAAPPSLQ